MGWILTTASRTVPAERDCPACSCSSSPHLTPCSLMEWSSRVACNIVGKTAMGWKSGTGLLAWAYGPFSESCWPLSAHALSWTSVQGTRLLVYASMGLGPCCALVCIFVVCVVMYFFPRPLSNIWKVIHIFCLLAGMVSSHYTRGKCFLHGRTACLIWIWKDWNLSWL